MTTGSHQNMHIGNYSALEGANNEPFFHSALSTHSVVDHLPRLTFDVPRAGIVSLLLKLTFACAPSGSSARCVSS